ncbi:AP2-associated protein kinase 1 [Exaiptasia diaphana]|uniref:WAP domain-containing protein n=1 Tax=Exaiptasia diaphana TaxID=2652724 RepID=A0A913YC98_EXADI|nr:AP2-associated protein kinase 1 [Exaiptasia diaphana]KXJ19449.1 hypothetical protein AC249_AIPGENE1107 [Exaiptasia diaphana]
MKPYMIIFFACLVVSSYAGSITRNKRGYLSRTGLCPNPANNFQVKDVRLNYWGMAVIRESDNPTPRCNEKECDEDSHCDGNRKCCSNYCGAKVCTVSMRDPEPCSNFNCPSHQVCKVQMVKCVMPDCPAAESINRPTCVPKDELITAHADQLGDYQPDTAADLLKTEPQPAQPQPEALSYTQQQQQQPQQTPYGDVQFNDAQQAAPASPSDQQAYAAPMDPSMMAAAAPAEVPNIVQSPMDKAASYNAPSQDTALNYQAQPAEAAAAAAALPPPMDQPAADQPPESFPQVVAQPPAQ